MNYAKAIVGGNLTRDPELTYAKSGTPIASFTIAVNEKRQDKEETSYIDCKMFGARATAFVQFHSKGQAAFVDGTLKQERWEDKKTGATRSKMVVLAWGWEFVGGANERKARAPQNWQERELEDPDEVPF
jgi:single-strand DNA-binding protein